MAKIRKYHVVLSILREAKGEPVAKKTLADALGDGLGYRISSYIWDIKHLAGYNVTTVKNGRNVLAFVLGDRIEPTHTRSGKLILAAREPVSTQPTPASAEKKILVPAAAGGNVAADSGDQCPVNIL